MLSSKQRAALRAAANGLETILYIGKGGVTDSVVAQTDEALAARELIKGSVQQNAPLSAKETLDALCQATNAEPVMAAGRKFVLYRARPENPVVKL
jgi:Predicted RNA-binding protein containing KH domain, possibly ribosomal protein